MLQNKMPCDVLKKELKILFSTFTWLKRVIYEVACLSLSYRLASSASSTPSLSVKGKWEIVHFKDIKKSPIRMCNAGGVGIVGRHRQALAWGKSHNLKWRWCADSFYHLVILTAVFHPVFYIFVLLWSRLLLLSINVDFHYRTHLEYFTYYLSCSSWWGH